MIQLSKMVYDRKHTIVVNYRLTRIYFKFKLFAAFETTKVTKKQTKKLSNV